MTPEAVRTYEGVVKRPYTSMLPPWDITTSPIFDVTQRYDMVDAIRAMHYDLNHLNNHTFVA